MHSVKLKGGAAGRSSLALSASNNAKKGQTSLATGVAAALASTLQVTLQLLTSEGACFSATLSETKRQESDRFVIK